MLKRLCILVIGLAMAGASVCGWAFADDGKLKKEQLDQLLAPIALYPDDLLTNVLMASTYPLDVVEAARWKAESANAKLQGDALAKALEAKDWDPSVKALVQFPDVLKTMSDKLDWTQKLGDAFLAQQDEVMNEIQFLRQKADDAGNLKSNKQQKVVRESGDDARPIYIIEPATPETVYVPVYEPTVVYGPWWYPAYPPYYWPHSGASFVNGFFWGAGVAVAANIWGWNHFDWHHHDIDIDVNKWNNINVDRNKITNSKWEHRGDHRGPVPYGSKDVRDKFKQADRGQIGNKDFRGFDKSDADRSKIEARLKDTDHTGIKDRAGDGGGANLKDKIDGGGAAAKLKDRDGDRKVNRAAGRPGASRPSPGAFDVKRGADVRRQADRGKAARVSMAGHGGQPRLGGGGHRPGGGGHRGGGRRR